LISLGICDNWVFEKDFLKLNPTASVVGVDHTIGPAYFIAGVPFCLGKILGYAAVLNGAKLRKYSSRLCAYIDYFTFFRRPHKHLKKRVCASTGGPLDITLPTILSTEAPSGGCDVFLKMDIEGSEYEIVPDILQHQLRIRCLIAEFHRLHQRTQEFNQAISSLAQHFSIVHIHGNNIGPYDATIDFPISVEITWVNKNLLASEPEVSMADYPRKGLDFPNTPTRPDYQLGL